MPPTSTVWLCTTELVVGSRVAPELGELEVGANGQATSRAAFPDWVISGPPRPQLIYCTSTSRFSTPPASPRADCLCRPPSEGWFQSVVHREPTTNLTTTTRVTKKCRCHPSLLPFPSFPSLSSAPVYMALCECALARMSLARPFFFTDTATRLRAAIETLLKF